MVVNDYAVKRAQEKSDRLKGTDKYKTFRDPELMERSATAYVSSKNAYIKHQEDLNMKEVTYVGNDRGEIEDEVFQQLKDDGYTKAEIFKFIADARKKEKLVEKHDDILFDAKRNMQKIVRDYDTQGGGLGNLDTDVPLRIILQSEKKVVRRTGPGEAAEIRPIEDFDGDELVKLTRAIFNEIRKTTAEQR